jgi:hypothetical protein
MSASEGAAMNDAVLTQRRDEVLLITLNRPAARALAFAEKRPPQWSGT